MSDKEIFQEVTNHLMDKFPFFSSYIMSGMSEIGMMHERQERHKKEILNRWEETKQYPRKLKKMTRKRLELEWSIANWNPLKF